MRYGRISYNAEDVTKWKDRWRPSDKQASDLMEDWKSTPVAKVQFISTANGGVRLGVVKATPSFFEGYWRRRGMCFICMVVCFLVLYLCWNWDLGSVVGAGAAKNDTKHDL